MLSTYLRNDAAKKLRHGIPWAGREEIVSIDGTPGPGEPVLLRDEDGRVLGVADVDLQSKVAVRLLGLGMEPVEGIIQRHLRHALERRAHFVDDPRYCRLVNDDGDGLPGLVVDRYDTHFVVQTWSRAMDTRVEEIARSLVEVMGANSVLLRNDSPRRELLGLPRQRPHVLFGTPPRWSRVLEMGARLTADLYAGPDTGFAYELREVRRLISRIAFGARVLDPAAGIGSQFVHAGRHGARSVLAFERDDDLADLARENAEANGLLGRARVEKGAPEEALSRVEGAFDLVLMDSHSLRAAGSTDDFIRLARQSVQRTRHGGRLVVIGYHPPVSTHGLDDALAEACEQAGRVGFRLARPALPADFPTVLGAPGALTLSAVAIEVS